MTIGAHDMRTDDYMNPFARTKTSGQCTASLHVLFKSLQESSLRSPLKMFICTLSTDCRKVPDKIFTWLKNLSTIEIFLFKIQLFIDNFFFILIHFVVQICTFKKAFSQLTNLMIKQWVCRGQINIFKISLKWKTPVYLRKKLTIQACL